MATNNNNNNNNNSNDNIMGVINLVPLFPKVFNNSNSG